MLWGVCLTNAKNGHVIHALRFIDPSKDGGLNDPQQIELKRSISVGSTNDALRSRSQSPRFSRVN